MLQAKKHIYIIYLKKTGQTFF